MKNGILYIIMAVAVTLSSCVNQDGIPQGAGPTEAMGTLILPDMGFSEAINVVNTRADDPRAEGFEVTITNQSDGRRYLDCTVAEMRDEFTDGTLKLPVGSYTITVISGEVKDAAWEEPYYRATQDFEIAKNTPTQIADLVCKLANIMVSVEFTPEFLELLTQNDGVVDVYFGTEELAYGQAETRSGFFKADNAEGVAYEALYWEFSGTVEGDKIVDNGLVKPVKAGQHQILTFDIRKTPMPGEGEIEFGFTVSVSVVTVDLNLNIDVTEEVVEPYNPAVEITSDYKDGQRHTIKKSELGTTQPKMSLAAAEGLKNVYITLTIDGNPTAAGALAGMGLTGTLDLANPGAMETLLTTAGLPVGAAVKGQERVNVDFTTLLNLLLTFGTIPEVDIEIFVYDNQGNPASATLKFALVDDSVPATIVIEGIDGFVLDTPQTIYVTDTTQPTVGVEMTVPNKIALLTCQIISEHPMFSPAGLADVGLSDNLNLTNPDAAYADAIGLLGLPTGDMVLGKTSLTVDVSSFVPMITALYAGSPFDVEFVMTVKDELGEEASRSIMLHVEESR